MFVHINIFGGGKRNSVNECILPSWKSLHSTRACATPHREQESSQLCSWAPLARTLTVCSVHTSCIMFMSCLYVVLFSCACIRQITAIESKLFGENSLCFVLLPICALRNLLSQAHRRKNRRSCYLELVHRSTDDAHRRKLMEFNPGKLVCGWSFRKFHAVAQWSLAADTFSRIHLRWQILISNNANRIVSNFEMCARASERVCLCVCAHGKQWNAYGVFAVQSCSFSVVCRCELCLHSQLHPICA